MSSPLPVIASATDNGQVLFHLSLNVDDLTRSVDFFRLLFDQPPSKHQRDYAKFELSDPPLVLSLEPTRTPRGGKLNHLGFRLANSAVLVAMQKRLELGGISTSREEGVECCYARQTKFWVTDPDGNLWEMYTFEADLEHRGMGQVPRKSNESVAASDRSAPAPAIWAHRLGEPFPVRILADSDGVDEVLLQGTFNARLTSEQRRGQLVEVLRILKPAGRVMLHQLTAERSVATIRTPLPGPAVAVEAVPTAEEIADDLAAAGFIQVEFEKLGDNPCFNADGVACRETKLIGHKRAPSSTGPARHVLYKGPYRQLEDDLGNHFRRGVWTEVDAATWQSLAASSLADQFAMPR